MSGFRGHRQFIMNIEQPRVAGDRVRWNRGSEVSSNYLSELHLRGLKIEHDDPTYGVASRA